ncbi:hypothetical protein MSAR_21190 [Mycolicibacterium sarraceniae]|uniref:Uncharacterized protein n=1 Tax=Mycolicibacterium sarraceniae TaxID=1534348 RepID=A0A7I7SQF2_9MYCO|nr:hypothetical protein MSAR_21190 [Mycolicibacterium sarraceniae]
MSFPSEPHRSGRYHPHGLQMHKVVTGMLSRWGICEQGDWWGLVTCEIAYGSQGATVTHWVPAWNLRQKPGRPCQMRLSKHRNSSSTVGCSVRNR